MPNLDRAMASDPVDDRTRYRRLREAVEEHVLHNCKCDFVTCSSECEPWHKLAKEAAKIHRQRGGRKGRKG